MAVHIKICGIKSLAEAQLVSRLGATEIGFHVDLFGARSAIAAETAAAIIAGLPQEISPVVVTSETDAKRLVTLAKQTGAAILQLYGEVTVETIATIKTHAPAIRIWKGIDATGADAIDNAKIFERAADAIALDSVDPLSGQRGGTGKTHDWRISHQIVETVSVPVILAGGLNPDNIVEAIRTVHPHGVDVNSGVSNADGTKNEEKIRLFMKRTKNAAV